uniref:Uncharacterized protein n=1 Tax=Oryza barthii TaxID=65489 RepID=A0A0D3FU97_9ORYZ
MGSASADNTMGGDNNCAATVTTMIVKASRGADPLVPISGATLVKERQGVAVEVQDRLPGPATGGSIQGGEGVLRRGGNNFRCNDNDIGLRWRQRQWEWEHGFLVCCAPNLVPLLSISRGLMSSVAPRAARLKDDVDGTYQTISLQWCVTLDGCGTYMQRDRPISLISMQTQKLAQQWCRYGVNVSSCVSEVLIQQRDKHLEMLALTKLSPCRFLCGVEHRFILQRNVPQ